MRKISTLLAAILILQVVSGFCLITIHSQLNMPDDDALVVAKEKFFQGEEVKYVQAVNATRRVARTASSTAYVMVPQIALTAFIAAIALISNLRCPHANKE